MADCLYPTTMNTRDEYKNMWRKQTMTSAGMHMSWVTGWAWSTQPAAGSMEAGLAAATADGQWQPAAR